MEEHLSTLWSNEIELRTDISQHTWHIIRNVSKICFEERRFESSSILLCIPFSNILKCHSVPNYFLPLLSFSYSKHRSQYIYKTNVLRRWWKTQINNNKSLWTKHTDTEVETKRTSVRFEMSLNCTLLLDLWNDCVKKFNANSTLYQQNCNFMPFEFQASLFCWLSNGYRSTAGSIHLFISFNFIIIIEVLS